MIIVVASQTLAAQPEETHAWSPCGVRPEKETGADIFHEKFELIRQIIKFSPIAPNNPDKLPPRRVQLHDDVLKQSTMVLFQTRRVRTNSDPAVSSIRTFHPQNFAHSSHFHWPLSDPVLCVYIFVWFYNHTMSTKTQRLSRPTAYTRLWKQERFIYAFYFMLFIGWPSGT